jgi:hypothetical protein
VPAIVRANLLKTSTNSPVISDSWDTVAKKLRLGLRTDAIRSQFAPNGVAMAAGYVRIERGDRYWSLRMTPSGAPNHRRHCNHLGRAGEVVLGVPLGSRAAHVVQLWPVRVEQGFGQSPQEVGYVGGQARSLP